MKPRLLPIVFTFVIALSISAPVDAASAKKRDRSDAGRILSRFDRNQDQKIDAQEAERLRRVFSALAALDTDHDGKLSDAEFAVAKVERGRRAKKTKTE